MRKVLLGGLLFFLVVSCSGGNAPLNMTTTSATLSTCPSLKENSLLISPPRPKYRVSMRVDMKNSICQTNDSCFRVEIKGQEEIIATEIAKSFRDRPVSNLAVFFLNDIGYKKGRVDSRYVSVGPQFLALLFNALSAPVLPINEGMPDGFRFDNGDVASVPLRAIGPDRWPPGPGLTDSRKFFTRDHTLLLNYLYEMNARELKEDWEAFDKWADAGTGEDGLPGEFQKLGVIITWAGDLSPLVKRQSEKSWAFPMVILSIGKPSHVLDIRAFPIGEPPLLSTGGISEQQEKERIAQALMPFKESLNIFRSKTRQIEMELPEQVHPPVEVELYTLMQNCPSIKIKIEEQMSSEVVRWGFIVMMIVFLFASVSGIIPILGYTVTMLERPASSKNNPPESTSPENVVKEG